APSADRPEGEAEAGGPDARAGRVSAASPAEGTSSAAAGEPGTGSTEPGGAGVAAVGLGAAGVAAAAAAGAGAFQRGEPADEGGEAPADRPAGVPDRRAEIDAAADAAGATEPEAFASDEQRSAQIPAPREEQQPEPRTSEAAGPAIAALDSGLVGRPTSFGAAAAAAAAAVSARPGPYPGSLLPEPDGSSPSPMHEIKANEGSRRFHTPDSPYYVRTRADVWFRTAEEARTAGFTAWDERRCPACAAGPGGDGLRTAVGAMAAPAPTGPAPAQSWTAYWSE